MMSFKSIFQKIFRVNLSTILTSAIVITSVAGTILTFWFLFTNVYQSIDDAYRLSTIKGEVVEYTLDTKLFETVETNLNEKTEFTIENLETISNPFKSKSVESEKIKQSNNAL